MSDSTSKTILSNIVEAFGFNTMSANAKRATWIAGTSVVAALLMILLTAFVSGWFFLLIPAAGIFFLIRYLLTEHYNGNL